MHIDLSSTRYLVVGAGFFGAVVAEHIARELGERVVVIERRDHIGGNCHSEIEPQTGIEFHRYGTHIFHTSRRVVWDYLHRFTSFNAYRHQVLTTHHDRVYQMPINLETINAFYGVSLRPYEVDDFLAGEIAREGIEEPSNLEEKAISCVGRPLYEAFIRDYTTKQWGRDPRELPASIIQRLPFRKNYDENYFFDPWQGIPIDGYAALFERMLDHPKIEVHLNTDFLDLKHSVPETCLVVYSGPIDRYFHYEQGRLECRTLRFESEVVSVGDYQGTSVMNYSDAEVAFTRVHEPRHLHPERDYPEDRTLIIREYPQLDRGDSPYYPIDSAENRRTLELYRTRRAQLPNLVFGGRLGDFKYYDMDATIANAMEVFQAHIAPWAAEQ